jgi:hypothetical protein
VSFILKNTKSNNDYYWFSNNKNTKSNKPLRNKTKTATQANQDTHIVQKTQSE